MKINLAKHGLIAAAMANIGGVLLFSKLFTNSTLNQADPVVMSNFGLVMIIVWGLAYFAAAFITSSIKWLAGVFVLEKLVYVLVWFNWHANNSLQQVFERDIFAGMFYSVYGINDIIFMLFFAWLFFTQNEHSQVSH